MDYTFQSALKAVWPLIVAVAVIWVALGVMIAVWL